ncbi:hypothetical protein ACFO5R_03135 [Halosolutus amylolyticus]|uniref:Uncharacterized protein n=1 Tax=Halosolutus amylolyticus TaxID=2932267 RepID=A0ABD5PKJ4_9EURY|nr:hypothetical protein [Halosolutus amylolyticus]
MARSLDTIDWGRAIERLCFLFPPVIGVGLIGVVREADPGVPFLERGLVLVGTFGYTLLTIALAVALFVDARRVRRRGGVSSHWKPNPWLNAAFAIVWAPVAGVFYLARRHRRFGTKPGWTAWWLVVAVTLGSTVIGALVAVVAFVLALPGLLTSAIGLAGAVAVGAFPIAIHQDAAHVCTYGDDWRPNPGVYLGIAFLSLSVPPLQPIVAGYYLARRHKAVGTP